MTVLEETVTIAGVNHPKWAFDQGKQAGLANNTTERGLMAFGLSCAATDLDARNTRGWLAGFDAGQGERQHGAESLGRGASREFFGKEG